MYRLFICSLIFLTCCQFGCSSLFNPDETIATALTSYFPDNGNSSVLPTQSLNSIVEEQGSTEGPSARSGAPAVDSTESTSDDLSALGEPLKPVRGASSVSSWEKIEQAVKTNSTVDGKNSSQANEHRSTQLSATPNHQLSKGLGRPPAQTTQKELIRIYDQINKFSVPPHVYQPVPPLIQRPVLFDESIVKTPIDSVTGSTLSNPASDISWKDSLEATIAHLNEELNSLESKSPQATKLKKCLHILKSVDTDKSFVELVDNLNAMGESLPPHHFEALRQIIATSGKNKSDLVSRLQDAVELVSETAALKIKKAAFCTTVDGFGKFERFTDYNFKPGEEVLLYCELENFTAKKRPADGKDSKQTPTHQCEFDAQIEFLDEQDATQFVRSFANITDQSATERKDFYLFFRFQIPKLLPGNHKLQIRLKDKIGNKSTMLESPILFEVADQ